MSVIGFIGLLDIKSNAVISSSLFLTNYWHVPEADYFRHLWSVAVEEHFYIIWPLALILSLRFSNNKKIAILVSIVVICLSSFLRLVTHLYGSEYMQGNIYFLSHTRADSLMFGSLLAMVVGCDYFEKIYSICAKYIWIMAGYFLIASPLLTFFLGGKYIFIFGYTIEGVCISLTLWLIRSPQSIVGVFLNSPLLVHIGLLSYSLYLWQQLFLSSFNKTIFGIFPISLVALYLSALISFHFIEKPSLRLRNKFIS